MTFLQNSLYNEDIETVAGLPIEWDELRGKKVLIAGGTGLLGCFLVDVLMYKNVRENLNCTIVLLGRDEEKARQRFGDYFQKENFVFYPCDINKEIQLPIDSVHYIIHAASNTHPVLYSTDPIGTLMTNIIGTKNLLEFAKKSKTQRVLFLSSVEIYGENRGDCEKYKEDYCGYIDCNTVRAGYTEGKRAGEALCQAYIKQESLDIVIPRLARVYGPTMLMSDTKALSQFLKKGIMGEDIVLKSDGSQHYSYCYVADAVSSILYCLFRGKCGEAYNVADVKSDITLKKLAELIANVVSRKVIFELPSSTEKEGFSKATKALLDSAKLQEIGWKAHYSIEDGISRTINILREDG